MAKLGNLYLDGKFPVSTNRLNHFDRLFGQALFGGVEKSVDYAPIISVSNALAKPAIDLQCKITAIQEGSGDPSPQNIRNIIGFSGLSLFRGGKNLYNDSTYTDGKYINNSGTLSTSSGYLASDYIPVARRGVYITSGFIGSGTVAKHAFYDENKTFISAVNATQNPITMPDNCAFVRLSIRTTGMSNVQFEAGTQATDYAPFTEITEIPVTWQTEAGTVYGGVVDLTTGVLTVTHASIAFSDIPSANWRYSNNSGAWNSYLFFTNLTVRNRITESICSAYKYVKETNVPADSYILPTWSTWFYVRDDSLTSINDFLTARGNERIVFELATPQTYTLTPQAVQLLAGNNTLWNTAGDTALTYMAKK